MAFVEDLPFELTHQAEAEAAEVPRLCSGVELLGRYEDSGFKEAPCIARRGDGQIVQLAPLLYALAEEVDGERTVGEIADGFSERIQRGVEPAMVKELLDGQLRRLGLVAAPDGQTGEVAKVDPLLALKFRTKVVPQPMVRAITTIFRPLFWPPILVVALVSFLALDVWLFGVHGISQGTSRSTCSC
jgi:putative peptide zinc metalloprotease protein